MDMVNYQEEIKRIKSYAVKENVPIIQDDGIKFLTKFIIDNNIKNILEIGTAIGYSAIMMASINNTIKITTVERDDTRYLEAVKNIKACNLEDRINLIFKDALELKLDDKYDLIFLDAAKAQNINFFNNFKNNLNENGVIITDNMYFHGFVNKPEEEIESKNVRALVRKIKDYREFLENNEEYQTTFLDVGDGIAITTRKNS